MIVRTAALMAAMWLGGVSWVIAQTDKRASDAPRPNIIFMMADDLGYGDIGPFGQKLIATPQLDRMAAEGTRFTHCYTGSPVCAPSRSVLMTGQHTGHTRVRSNSALVGGVSSERRVPLEAEDVTVAEILKSAGYATGITGKWGLGEPGTSGVPSRQGFDEWLGFLNQNHAVDYYTDYLWHNETRQELPANGGGRKGEHVQEIFTQFALDFIRRHQSEPFFLYLAWTTPHADREIGDLGQYADRDWPADARTTAAMISSLDGDVGRVLSLLKELRLDERTIVFFCSDNGVGHGHGQLFNSTPNLRGKKSDVYEGGMRTPMIVRWPGRVPADVTNDAPWYFADFLPTAAELAGARPPEKIDGISVLPTLLGQPQDLSSRMLYWEFPSGGFKQAIRWGDWKAVRLSPERPIELYNLRSDPVESHDVSTQHAEIVQQISAFMTSQHVASPYWPLDMLRMRGKKK